MTPLPPASPQPGNAGRTFYDRTADSMGRAECNALLDALLPVVARIADERAAEALEEAAEELLGFGDTAPSKANVALAAWLQATADNLRAASLRAASREETGR